MPYKILFAIVFLQCEQPLNFTLKHSTWWGNKAPGKRLILLPPANEVCEGYVFTGVCDSVKGGGGMRGFIRGACVVLFGGVRGFIRGGRAWFYSGGVCMVLFGGRAWFYSGGCVVLFGGHGFIRGACVVLFGGGHAWFYSGGAWFYLGGMHGFIRGGMRGFIRGGMRGFIRGGVRGFSSFFGYNEIRSMSGRYASYWNAFLF